MVKDLPEEWTDISIHALLAEGDMRIWETQRAASIFLSTPSSRRATCSKVYTIDIAHSISIHALLAEGDQTQRNTKFGQSHFYPRPPRGGRQRR